MTIAALRHSASTPFDLSAYDYDLPADLIAQAPPPDRAAARLLVLARRTGERLHSAVRELGAWLHPDDLLVLNDTRVVPARLFGALPTGGKVELLVVREHDDGTWECLGRPGRRLRPGREITLGERFRVKVVRVADSRVFVQPAAALRLGEVLAEVGELPLPPYIRRPTGPDPRDGDRYQTVYARVPGAIAAPTAGLHFTPELLADVRQRGVQIATLTLHVGPGTFLPVRETDVRLHRMEPEWVDIPPETATAIAAAKARGGRVIAVGTTTTRALESRAAGGAVEAGSGWADCFITPGYEFQIVDGLMTNFHLPQSTLLLLVSAFAGREAVLAAYADAVARQYRFYSYGDAMLIA